MKSPLVIDYYTDILCIWAWIAQRRIDELNNQLGDSIEIRYHYMDIFGDVENKMTHQWGKRGKYQGFAEHVKHAASPFDDAIVSDDIWQHVQPTTSANAHLYIKAVELAFDANVSSDFALDIRKAFYINTLDISNLKVLSALVVEHKLDLEAVQSKIETGQAMAALMNDYKSAKDLALKGSPSYIIDNGRQVLFGNVGFRVLLANVEERLKRPSNEASWC
ncbi:DsbA family protein [Thalassotalea fonticola]|uniref:DsbA family protein n=1 Tax=Thalassotalea fonticola TaxID=3065649 RepID=A0ABZ0GN78_9GAMM|nr:DsbA family protein [Colwelliaceae bacterium S1-1]